MSRLGPVITLAAGTVLAAGLGVASISAAPAADDTPPAAASSEVSSGVSAGGGPAASVESSAKPSPTRSAEQRIGKADYAGRVKGDGALIAISIRDGRAIGYFCDGTTESWFKGSQSAGEVRLTGVTGGKISAELGGGRAEGQVSVAGRKWTFTAPVAVKPSGLYRATALIRGAQFKAGWIRVKNPAGGYTTVGAATEGGSPVPVPELDGARPTAPLTVGGTIVQPKDVDGFFEEMR